jgi:hypothetical protein
MKGTQRDPRFVIGMIVNCRGQPYELVAIEPRQRRDGRNTLILVWRSRCHVCGNSFETTTPQRKLKYPTRRCRLHAKGV